MKARLRPRAQRRQAERRERRQTGVALRLSVSALELEHLESHLAELAERFAVAYDRWMKLTAVTSDACPLCGELVIVNPRMSDSATDLSHAQPVCEMWVLTLEALGAGNRRWTEITKG